MKQRKFRVFAPLSPADRARLLLLVRPRFENVFCFGVTYAYGVSENYPFPDSEAELVLDGHHVGSGHEALTGLLRQGAGVPARWRPDGKIIHVTLSTVYGVPPVRAGEIEPYAIMPIRPISCRVRLARSFAEVYRPVRADAA